MNTKETAIPGEIVNIWQRIVDSASIILGVPSVMVNRLEPPNLEVIRSNICHSNPFPNGTRIPMMGVYCESAAKQRKMLIVEDARNDPEWSESPTAKAGIFAYLGFPLFWPDGDIFGTLCAVDVKENKWGDQYENLMRTFKDAIEAHLALTLTTDALEKKNLELELSLSEVKTLRGILPICASCKKIRDDSGYWSMVEHYIEDHSEAQFSHSICPDCAKKLYPSFCDKF